MKMKTIELTGPAFRILNTRSGADLGTWIGPTADDALDAMARAAGYSDYADLNEQVPAGADELMVEEVTRRADEITSAVIELDAAMAKQTRTY